MGALPIIIPYSENRRVMEEYIRLIDGVLFIGGRDVDPSCYGEKLQVSYCNDNNCDEKYNRISFNRPNRRQDIFEIEIYKISKKYKKPILGICRGAQIINIAEGGSLHQENPDSNINHYFSKDMWINYHNVNVLKESSLYKIMGKQVVAFPSIHHQSIKKLGENLMVSGRAEDGIIEIIEGKGEHFLMGVQGHIENTFKNFPDHEKILKKFIDGNNNN